MTHLPHVRQGRTRDLSQERLAGPDQARGWDDFGCNHTKSTSRLVTQLTSRSSRARFAVSDRTGPQRAGRLNSGVRRRQTKIFSTWGSPTERHRNSRCQSATYSVQLESSCTPSVDQLSREKLAGAQNQFCAAGPGLTSLLWNSGPTQRQLAGQPPNNSSKPTPLRGVVIASRYQTNTPPQSGAS